MLLLVKVHRSFGRKSKSREIRPLPLFSILFTLFSSESEQGVPNPALWLATRAGKTTRSPSREKTPRTPYNKSFIKRKFTRMCSIALWTNCICYTSLTYCGEGSCLQHVLPILWKSRTILNNYVVYLKTITVECEILEYTWMNMLTPGNHQSYDQQHKFICRNFSIWHMQLCNIITKHSSIYNTDYKRSR